VAAQILPEGETQVKKVGIVFGLALIGGLVGSFADGGRPTFVGTLVGAVIGTIIAWGTWKESE
jgi:outer membrane lipoprotein SlyB